MVSKYTAKSDLYQDFLLCVKFQVPVLYRFYEDLHKLLKHTGWAWEASLERVEEDITYRDDDYMGCGMLLMSSEGEEVAILEHETGAEAWIIPTAAFIASAIASGVIGNAAYDMIRKLYRVLSKAREEAGVDSHSSYDDPYSHIAIKLRTPDYETIDLTRETVGRQREIIERAVLYRMKQFGAEWSGITSASATVQSLALQGLEKRIEQLEDQVRTIALKHLELESEFQKERTAWRRRSTHANRGTDSGAG